MDAGDEVMVEEVKQMGVADEEAVVIEEGMVLINNDSEVLNEKSAVN